MITREGLCSLLMDRLEFLVVGTGGSSPFGLLILQLHGTCLVFETWEWMNYF